MKNPKVSTFLGIIVLAVIAITAGMFMWLVEKRQEIASQPQTTNDIKKDAIQKLTANQQSQSQEAKLSTEEIADLMKDSKTYKNTAYGFELAYPKEYYYIEKHNSPSTEEYLIKNSSDTIIRIKLTKWKGYAIKERTPGTEYERRALAGWKYFVDNFRNIQSGICDNETIIHVLEPTIAERPKNCMADKQNNYIKIETDNSIIYYTKTLQISMESSSQNLELLQKLSSTLKIN
jgi:hypothetical protein